MRKGSLSSVLLLLLEKSLHGILLIDEISYSEQMRSLRGLPGKKRDLALVMTIRRLRMKGLIESAKNEEGMIFLKLTNAGTEFLQGNKESAWDGRYRVVIWDIPESKRTIRNLLRRKLKTWGFVSFQKSVWVSKRNVTVQLRNLIADLGIDKWVAVIESDDPSLASQFH